MDTDCMTTDQLLRAEVARLREERDAAISAMGADPSIVHSLHAFAVGFRKANDNLRSERDAATARAEAAEAVVNQVCALFKDSTPDVIAMVVGAYIRTIEGVRKRQDEKLAAAQASERALRDALSDLLACISETRGMNSYNAEQKARKSLAQSSGEALREHDLALVQPLADIRGLTIMDRRCAVCTEVYHIANRALAKTGNLYAESDIRASLGKEGA